jgi:hypothetical protein
MSDQTAKKVPVRINGEAVGEAVNIRTEGGVTTANILLDEGVELAMQTPKFQPLTLDLIEVTEEERKRNSEEAGQ